jgi:hypothetical protein
MLLLALPAAGEGAVTIGADLAALTPGSGYNCSDSHQCTVANTSLEPGVTASGGFASPVTGTVVSFQVRTGADTAPLQLRILRAAGAQYTGAGTSSAVTPPANQISLPFPVNLPIQAGDLVGLNCCQSSLNDNTTATSAVGNYASWGILANPLLADGETRAPDSPDHAGALMVSAVVEPSSTVKPDNAFTLGAVTRNKKKGTATLTLTLPNPGELTASGNGVKASSAGAVISKSVGAGQAQLLIKAKGKKKKKLNQKGKVKLNVAVTYTPTGGDPSSQSIKVKLKKRL